MAKVVICRFQAPVAEEDLPWPVPGTDDAVDQGCTCPQDQEWPADKISFAVDCPIHELRRAN